MAGPGGGPPRKSHTKSRKGCENCKRRHIRCDESFPQCRNCTKHKVRCPYNDSPAPEERSLTPERPNLLWTPEIEASIGVWQRDGVFPFPALNVYPVPSPQFLPIEHLRLIHHVAAISNELLFSQATGFTLWTKHMPLLISISSTNDYVMHALLAFSATHMAYLTDCPAVAKLASEYRNTALHGLNDAIGCLTKATSEAILAAQLLLSLQTTESEMWEKVMHGSRAIVDLMDSAWRAESQFGDFIAESSTFPGVPMSPNSDSSEFYAHQNNDAALQVELQHLHKVEMYLRRNGEETKPISQLSNFLKAARKVNPALPVGQQFERLRSLRTWLLWLPVSNLQRSHLSASSLIVIAHYYTAALLMSQLFPAISTAYFGSMTIEPLENIAREIFAISNNDTAESGSSSALELMGYPIAMVSKFRERRGLVQPVRTASFPQFDPLSLLSADIALTIPGTASEAFLPYSPNPAFNCSTEDLAVFTNEPLPVNGASPLAQSSPFGHHQYLNVPSPSYGGWSPNSSTYGDFGENASAVYSDTEELGPLDYSLPQRNSIVSCHDQFDFNNPPQIMSTTPTYSPTDNSLLLTGPGSKYYHQDYLHPHHPMERFHSISPVPSLLGPYSHHRHNLSTASAPATFC